MGPKDEVVAEAADEPIETSEMDEQEGSEPIAEEETSDSSDESSASEKTDEAEEADEVEESQDELKDILKESKSKGQDNVQKRIDQLTAQLKELKAENQKLQGKEPTDKEPVYTDAQLKSAMKKALEEGDSDLIWDIMDYRTKQVEKSLVTRYENEKKTAEERYKAINNEWQKVTMDYSRVWEDEKGREIYAGAKKDLDITNENSLLYKLAAELYTSVDEDGQRQYNTQGGQKAAVADALSAILRRKKLSPVDSEKKRLQRTLAKEKRKRSLSGLGSSEAEAHTQKRPLSEADKLAEYIAERKKHQSLRTNR